MKFDKCSMNNTDLLEITKKILDVDCQGKPDSCKAIKDNVTCDDFTISFETQFAKYEIEKSILDRSLFFVYKQKTAHDSWKTAIAVDRSKNIEPLKIDFPFAGCSSETTSSSSKTQKDSDSDFAFSLDVNDASGSGDLANHADHSEELEEFDGIYWCNDPAGNDYFVKGTVTFINPDNEKDFVEDSCKVEGENGMLAEATCQPYNSYEGSFPASLMEYVNCHCVDGQCIDDTVQLCTDYNPNLYYPGGSVWIEGNGTDSKTHVSFCEDEDHVSYLYCNDDGTLHEDIIECEAGIKCGDGMCGGFICTDNELEGEDPGNLHKGAVYIYNPTTGQDETFYDYCTNSPSMKEVAQIRCPQQTETELTEMQKALRHAYGECAEDMYCNDGICAEEQDVTCLYKEGDTENDIHKNGILHLKDNIMGIEYTIPSDACANKLLEDNGDGTLSPNVPQVWQKNCDDNGMIVEEKYDCLEGEMCVAGICIFNDCGYTCSETDDGIDVMNPGVLHLNSACGNNEDIGSSSDKCHLPTEVKELYCDGNLPKYSIVECPDDHFCIYESGAAFCSPCNDDDKGDDPGQPGKVIDANGTTIDDHCNNSGELIQVYCDDSNGFGKMHDPESCPPGTTCNNGACN